MTFEAWLFPVVIGILIALYRLHKKL